MYDVIIIGAGPAGLTAAAYSARSMLKTLVIERYPLTGGQMLLTDVIANFPAYVPSDGSEIANLKAQAEEAGAEFITAEVTRIADGKPKTVLAGGKEYRAKALIIACGAEHKKLGVQGEDKFAGRGVSYCAVCDGGFSEKGYCSYRRRGYGSQGRIVSFCHMPKGVSYPPQGQFQRQCGQAQQMRTDGQY